MARKAMIEKEKRRIALSAMHFAKRQELKKTIKSFFLLYRGKKRGYA